MITRIENGADDFQSLLDAMCDRELTSEEVDRLEHSIRQDADARRRYCLMATLCAELEWTFPTASETARTVAGNDQAKDVPRAAEAVAVWVDIVRMPKSWANPRLVKSIAAVMLVTISFWAVMAFWVMPRWRARTANGIATSTENLPQSFVGRVSAEVNCQWADSPALTAVDRQLTAGRLELLAGTAEIMLGDGVRTLLQGPSVVDVRSASEVALERGRLMARVDKGAIGFTVETPTAKVVDLGTEFGVEVDPTGETAVQVLEGAVEFSSSRKQKVNDQARSQKQRLQAGQAARTSATAQPIVATDFVPDKFVREITPAAKPGRRTVMIDLKTATATQSSDHRAGIHPPQLAIDGNFETASSTEPSDLSPWIQVDLGQTRSIGVVVLYGRALGAGWFRDITVKILAEDGETIVATSPTLNPKNSLQGDEQNFDQGPLQLAFDLLRTRGQSVAGRFVRIERKPCDMEVSRMKTVHHDDLWIDGCKNSLVLCELQIFGPLEPSSVNTQESPRP